MKRFTILCLFITQIAAAQNFVSFLDVSANPNNAKETRLSANSTTIPFTMMEGMMLVEATVNQEKGNFIIDTGAPTLVLNEMPTTENKVSGRGISEGLVTDEVVVQEFSWSGIQKKNVDAFKVDISHLEAVSGKVIAGIIGYDILKEVELLVDYDAQLVQLRPLKDKSKQQQAPVAIIPFTMQAHLPVIKVRVGGKKLRLALDTASESNILNQKVLKKLDAQLLSNFQVGEIQGVDQQIKTVQVATVQQTDLKNLSFYPMDYLFTDLSHLKASNLYIDGLLGYPFFKQGKMSINYKEQKIYVWAMND